MHADQLTTDQLRAEVKRLQDLASKANSNAALMHNTAWHDTIVWVGSGAVGMSVELYGGGLGECTHVWKRLCGLLQELVRGWRWRDD